jgi:hypothetical protein
MALSWRARVSRAANRVIWPLLAAAGVIALAGCGPDGAPNLNAAQPRGATVAFESIDGPPPAQFKILVQNLNEEAQARRLAVTSRESPAAYRVRGYLAAEVEKGKTTISWVWDVFDGDQHRALRIAGAETAKGHDRDAWAVADDAMLKHIARSSMDQLAAFLTSPAVAPSAAVSAAPQVAFAGNQGTTPEEAGIFRIVNPQADAPSETDLAPPPTTRRKAEAVPLPPSRPATTAAVSTGETITLAAASHANGR